MQRMAGAVVAFIAMVLVIYAVATFSARKAPQTPQEDPIFFLTRLTEALVASDPGQQVRPFAETKDSAEWQRAKSTFERSAKGMERAVDRLSGFESSADPKIREMAAAGRQRFLSLQGIDAQLSERFGAVAAGFAGPQASSDWFYETEKKREAEWAGINDEVVTPLLQLLVADPAATPPTLRTSRRRRQELRVLFHTTYADMGYDDTPAARLVAKLERHLFGDRESVFFTNHGKELNQPAG